MSTPLRVGIVGYGFATSTFHAPLIAAVPGLALTAISSSDTTKVHKDWPQVEAESSSEALFARADIDLVVIPTPNTTHAPLARAALEAGKHVVVDKPFTITLAEAEELCAVAKRCGKLLSVFHNRRWDADFLTLRKLIASGELGEIMHFESHFDRYRPEVRQRWREQALPGSGLWYDLGAHLLDQTIQLFGMPEAISVDTAIQRTGAQADDWFHALLRYGERRVILHASALVPRLGPRFAVHGTQGSFIKYGLDTQEDALKAGARPPAANWGHDPLKAEITVWAQGERTSREEYCELGNYPAYYTAIRDAIQSGTPNPVPAEDAIQVMRLIEAGIASIRERREIPFA
ncbi:oxidoreductase [Uliginosibacterium gangwonense]|uniref:oxidoreductase n=1 Tax=Uliginosibacterium gangwonense TaxID=392736 RepID=UPI000366F620|nr:oxidoreductase [Uliginosibacterium gangwonense]